MPVESELTIIKTLEKNPLRPVQPGAYRTIPLAHANIHAFCDQADKIGTLRFSGYIEDLKVIVGDDLKVIQPEQTILVSRETILICDDKNVVSFRHSNGNVLASFQRNLTEDKT